ncbi:MAG: hypothetical protein ABL949_13620 [Fimbriimonadaceae bacterium]
MKRQRKLIWILLACSTVALARICQADDVKRPDGDSSAFWQLTFVKGLAQVQAPAIPNGQRDQTGSTTGGSGGSGESGGASPSAEGGIASDDDPPAPTTDPLVKALQDAVPGALVTRINDTGLMIRGRQATVDAVVGLLAKYIDVPPSQVKVELFAFQVNEKLHLANKLAPSMELVKTGLGSVRSYQQKMLALISSFVGSQPLVADWGNPSAPESLKLVDLGRELATLGMIDGTRNDLPQTILSNFVAAKIRPKTLIETLLYSSAISGKDINIKLTDAISKGLCTQISADIDELDKQIAAKGTRGDVKRQLGHLRRLYSTILDRASNGRAFKNTIGYYQGDGTGDVEVIARFLSAWNSGSGFQLRSRSFVIDLLVQQISNAIHEDMDALFQNPSMEWARSILLENGGTGVNYLGHISVSGTSREPISYMGMASSVRKQVTYGSLADIGKPATGTTEASTTPKSGLGNLTTNSFAGSVSPQLDLLFTILESQKESYYTIAPGLSLGVRPTVMADGSTANLDIQVISAVSASDEDSNAKITSRFDTIQVSPLTTKVQVSAFDMFGLSTFGMDTATRGNPRWEIPGLSSLPIFGNMFKGPSSPDRRHQELVMFASVMIVPRALDLTARR